MGDAKRKQEAMGPPTEPVTLRCRLVPVRVQGVESTEPCPRCRRMVRVLDPKLAQLLEQGQEVAGRCACGQPVLMRQSLILSATGLG